MDPTIMLSSFKGVVPTREQPHGEEPHRKDSVSLLLPFVSSGLETHKTNLRNGAYANYTHNQALSTREHSASSQVSLSSPESFIDRLPFEVRLRIADELSQYDTLSLMRVNRAFFQSTVVRLYHTVIVDPSYSYFNQDVLSDSRPSSTATFIKMKYSIKIFLKTMTQLTPIQVSDFGINHVSYSIFINKLQFVELPDGFCTPFDLSFFAFMSIKKLEKLNRLYWGSEKELSFETIHRIPNKENLNSLHVNVDFKRLQSPSDFEAFKGFKNLEKLSIQQFLNSFNLFHMFKCFMEDNEDIARLKVLRLSRLDSSHGFIKNPSTSMLVLTSYIIENEPVKLSEYDMSCILNLYILFKNSSRNLDDLGVFSLDSVVVTSADAIRLATVMDLSKLEQLELRNITEVQFPDGVNIPLSMNELCTRLDPGFLRSLGSKLRNLTRLCIDYRESLRDTVPDFIRSIESLQELDVTIRWNVTKLCSVPSWKHLCESYIKAILKHAPKLKKLSLETKEDSVFCDLHKLIFTDCLLKLSGLSEIECLRLHGYALQPCAPLLASTLPRLKYFELFGSSAGGAPHMGLQVVHDGVLDDWLRVRHVALNIAEQNPHVRFVKIDKCLFELKDRMAIPRDGLESWFERKMRVNLGQDDF